MYARFAVVNFRCFGSLRVDRLQRVNLIAGRNNVGKTALLEALFVHMGRFNPDLTLRLSALRGVSTFRIDLAASPKETPWVTLFREFDLRRPIELEGQETSGKITKVTLCDRSSCPDGTYSRAVSPRPAGAAELPIGRIPTSDAGGRPTPPGATAVSSLAPFSISPAGRSAGQEESLRGLAPYTAPMSRVLELRTEGHAESPLVYQLVIDQAGMRIDPRPPSPPFLGIFLSSRVPPPPEEEHDRFGIVVKERREAGIVEALRVVEPRLQRLALASTGGVTMIHADIGLPDLVPVAFMGGVNRLLSLLLAMANAQGGVVLIDEVENGFHHSVLCDLWQAIANLARRFDLQVFATTHSLECIVAAHEAFKASKLYDFCLHRLDFGKEGIEAVRYDQETLEAALEAGFEVR